ncbi:amino acid ABC transporter substrate-binding protein [Actinoplanes sp. SE50]|uniref:substrate-binding domain-containing protein n=1 Tax=unclassified Actinoplanes TaxID=2626549 RepID=UPI00023EC5E0|nr:MULTISPECIES: substrate-binding domain-containing protein [unclassified Actinoplanes]AEV83642.1 Leu/Ile/Val-binding-like protein [Actinoplanes sp. SE50/110]ATO82214.1 amino acid ABC transporter substrate-binding protein [Actinoplanes sp. SE50]SLL99621.1 amino acid ABC transporter substrate-binding protein [Actinoplanes sp. SE50/110]
MRSLSTSRRAVLGAAVLSAVVVTTSACGSPKDAAGNGSSINVGVVYSQSGPLASYGAQYVEGFKAGLAYATDNTGKVGDKTITVTYTDDAGDPVKAVSAAKDLIGKGYRVLAGSTSSGVALQVAPIAAENRVLFVSGPAASDGVTGANRYTFRSGRQSYQDVLTARAYLGDGRKVLVFAPDTAFGKSNVDAVTRVLGGAGATVSTIAVPAGATDFTPFASQIKAAEPDLVFVAWAGTTAGAMWQALDQQGVLASTKVVTGLDLRAGWAGFGAGASKLNLLAHYFDGATDNPAYQALKAAVPGGRTDLFHPDGFAAAQMIVHALQASPDDTAKMIGALEGYSFDSVKGRLTVRAADHALLQPMFQARLTGAGDAATATLTGTVSAADTAPPAAAMKG